MNEYWILNNENENKTNNKYFSFKIYKFIFPKNIFTVT